MRLLRNSPAHIAAIARIDTEYAPKLNSLREHFLREHADVRADELDEVPAWAAISSGIRKEWEGELETLRSLVTDDVGEL